MGVSYTGATTTYSTSTQEPADSTFETGGVSWSPPPGVGFSGATTTLQQYAGMGAHGAASQGGEYVSGTVYLYVAGNLSGSTSLTDPQYVLTAIPSGVSAGESVRDRSEDTEIVVATESGGVAQTTLAGGHVRFSPEFAPLTVKILDAKGDPVEAATYSVDGAYSGSTSPDGTATVATSGTADVTALRGSKTKSVDVSGATTVTFRFAGIEGDITTPDGEAIVGKTVEALDTACETIEATQTDDSGHYDLLTLPISTDVVVVNDPYFRETTTRGEGEVMIKSFPARVMQKGDPCGSSTTISSGDLAQFAVECVDAETGEPAAAVPIEVGGYQTLSNASGIAYGVAETGATVTVTVGANDRYRRQRIEYDVTGSESLTVELTRFTESSQV